MRAMPQAMEWSLATPITSPRLPRINPWLCAIICIYPVSFWNITECPRQSYANSIPITLEHQRGIGAAEAKAVGQSGIDFDVVDALAHDIGVGDHRIDFLDIGAFADEPGLHHQQSV